MCNEEKFTIKDKWDIITCLKELDCCNRCILRYLKIKANFSGAGIYEKPQILLNLLFQEHLLDENKSSLDEDKPSQDEKCVPPKRAKKNPCRVCLDMLEPSTLSRYSEEIVHTNYTEYKYNVFGINVSICKSIYIRCQSMFYYLKQKFPHIYTDPHDFEELNKVFRLSIIELVSKQIGRTHQHFCPFTFIFDISYEDDAREIENIAKLNRMTNKKKGYSKSTVRSVLDNCKEEEFRQYFLVPPDIPGKGTTVTVTCHAGKIWIGGRYLKFSREMGQTPFIINGKHVTEHCVQDVLFDNICKVLGYDKTQLTFSSSGREDADTRMLGNGRPFYVEIDNPKDMEVTFTQCREIETEIVKSKVVAVIKLQKILKTHLGKIKSGEQFKRKHYKALCKFTLRPADRIVQLINSYCTPFIISQNTPLRVLHRRSLDAREKTIYHMFAKSVDSDRNLIEVDILSQAGTYIKEFVNGDFQRTVPSLTSILNQPIDVVALDVTNVELEFP